MKGASEIASPTPSWATSVNKTALTFAIKRYPCVVATIKPVTHLIYKVFLELTYGQQSALFASNLSPYACYAPRV
jgi:hypothetical protein